ncbi:serine/threonine-protein kinase [Mariniblastus fucicola]|uniref:Serine/threonine-protein kinase PknB n=1 Tax=Mariniblastus fucicola TaxID=980251 RepID=A0A5B9P807_9BACT|nr:protein kinase [Mariniblastus fucicola]QEG21619.1 Serine/threonine-protein kinase PknB [Mariniblastus fucicola]
MTIHRKKLPISALERIDDRCAAFERSWQSGQPLTIESVVSGDLDPDERNLLLSELLVLEIDYRRRKGETPDVADYAERFPEDATAIRDALGIQPPPSRGFVPPSIEQIGERFPTLEIIELLGAGGMGAVYKARQKGLDRMVALKILPEEFGHDVKFALRFTREARTLAKLNHPNIVSVFEFGNVDDIYYFLMEYVDGSTLRDVVRAGQLAPEHALTIVPHLCDALQYAHDQAVVHRDIKPENILMAKDGSVKIADFGLSRIIGNEPNALAQTALTQANQVLGTPRYMAPEQLEGSHGVDHRADIYSLGVVFYEMLTGELPIGRFEAPSQKVQIDVRLDEVVLRTLEKEPRRRYQTASQIKTDLDSIASSPDDSYSPTMVHSSREEMREKAGMPVPSLSLGQQETAARLLLSRRELMDRVRSSLGPLRRGQAIQIMIGVALILLGAQCWARNTSVPHRVISGVILHVYGVIVIGAAAHVLTRIGRMDFSKPVTEVRESLNVVRKAYLMTGPVIGFPWWLMWIPATVAIGFDPVLNPVLNPYCLWVSLAIGIPGLAISFWLYLRVLKSNKGTAKAWQKQFTGESLARAYMTLDEIERARIE